MKTIFSTPVRTALFAAVLTLLFLGAWMLVDKATSGPLGGCMLLIIMAAAAAFLFGIVVPGVIIYYTARWLLRRSGVSAARAAETPAAAAPAADRPAEEKERVVLKLKKDGRLDRLALVYYVEDALRSGMAPQAVAAALKAKGWPDAEIAAVLPQAGMVSA